jgi:hypothetical protein
LHILLACAALLSSLPGALKIAAWLATSVHAWLRFPRAWNEALVHVAGVWAIPGAGQFDLRIASGTRFSTWCVELELSNRAVTRRLLLLRDQFGADTWRRLQLAVREAPSGCER